jgi:hypothetical protein
MIIKEGRKGAKELNYKSSKKKPQTKQSEIINKEEIALHV